MMLSKSLSQIKNRIYYLKLQVNPLAHRKTPADYIILAPIERHLVECKQVNVALNDKATFSFDRLTQEYALTEFAARPNNQSWVLLGFVEKYARKSSYFLIPLAVYLDTKARWDLKSIRRSAAEEVFQKYRLTVKDNHLDLTGFFLS